MTSLDPLTLGVSLAGATLALLLFRGYRDGSRTPLLAFRTEQIGGYTRRGLVLAGLLTLYLELLLIRWISSEIRIFPYFENFVLMACFLGFGLGCHLARRAIHLVAPRSPRLFFFRSFASKAVIATLVFSLPVFFAGVVFIRRFEAAGFAADAIGSNLLGALAGA